MDSRTYPPPGNTSAAAPVFLPAGGGYTANVGLLTLVSRSEGLPETM